MSQSIHTDNRYPEGSFITAKANPSVRLVINKYFHRIYYCGVAGAPDEKNRVYFERELIPPAEGTA